MKTPEKEIESADIVRMEMTEREAKGIMTETETVRKRKKRK